MAGEELKTPEWQGTKKTLDGHDALSPEERWRMIAAAAYYRAERRGFAAGGEVEDWLAAEREVTERLNAVAARKPQSEAPAAANSAAPVRGSAKTSLSTTPPVSSEAPVRGGNKAAKPASAPTKQAARKTTARRRAKE